MPATAEEIAAVRREILDLLGQQMEALDSPLGLTHARLTECYERQARVHELREKLQAATEPLPEVHATLRQDSALAGSSPCGPQLTATSVDAPAGI
jgi:hypothetical protein